MPPFDPKTENMKKLTNDGRMTNELDHEGFVTRTGFC